MKLRFLITLVFFGLISRSMLAASGSTGASFLDIPVGAEPASLGSAYSALATNAYAPTWNAGGLGAVDSTQLAFQHLSYLESLNYEYASFAHPLKKGHSIGGAIQYLGAGNVTATDAVGNSIGSSSNHYGSYALSYGQMISSKLSLGVTGKMIQATLDGVNASAYAGDIGSLYQASNRWRLAAVVSNIGSKLKFLDQEDPLPASVRMGTYDFNTFMTGSLDVNKARSAPGSFHTGIEIKPNKLLSLRIGYRTDNLKELSSAAGFTTGVGINLYGHTLSYAWLPKGDLGNTQYISFLMRFRQLSNSNE